MKNVFLLPLLLCVSVSGFSSEPIEAPVLTKAQVSKLFVPQGINERDKVEIVVYGEFPNGCYSAGPVHAKLNLPENKVIVSAEAYYRPGVFCTMKVTPFTKTIALEEPVPAGTYMVEVLGQPDVKPVELIVAQQIDHPVDEDVLYASVKSATVVNSPEGRTHVVLSGQHPFLFVGCMKFDSIQTFISPDNVVDISPLTRITDDDDCRTEDHRNQFTETLVLSENLTRGEYLFHVRTLDGTAINKVVTIE